MYKEVQKEMQCISVIVDKVIQKAKESKSFLAL